MHHITAHPSLLLLLMIFHIYAIPFVVNVINPVFHTSAVIGPFTFLLSVTLASKQSTNACDQKT